MPHSESECFGEKSLSFDVHPEMPFPEEENGLTKFQMLSSLVNRCPRFRHNNRGTFFILLNQHTNMLRALLLTICLIGFCSGQQLGAGQRKERQRFRAEKLPRLTYR